MRKARKEKRARAAGRRALRGERDERPSPRPQTQTVADSFSRQQIQSREIRAGSGARIQLDPRPAGGGGGGWVVGPGFVGGGECSRAGWRLAPTKNARRPPPRSTQDINASWSGLGITPRVICHSLPSAEPLRLRVHPLPLAPLSRPSRVRSLVEDLLEWPSPPSHCHLHHLTAISTISLPSHCHLHPVAVRSLPHLLYHTRGGGGSGISCASLSSSASGSVVERRSQRSIADALDRKEIGRALRCSAQIDCPVRALK